MVSHQLEQPTTVITPATPKQKSGCVVSVLRVLLALVALLVVAVLLVPPVRVAGKTLLLLPQLFPQAPIRPLEYVTAAPIDTTVTLKYGDQSAIASLYRPNDGARHGAVVLFFGVSPAGLDDPRLIRLGEGLARIGVVTLIPRSQDLVNSKVDPGEVDELVGAFDYLEQAPYVAPNRVGLAGFCIGASLSLVAAEDPRIRDRVAFVNSFTGYFDLRDYMVEILSHSIQVATPGDGSTAVPWEPADDATTVLQDHLISLLPAGPEAAAIRAAVRDPAAPKPDPRTLSTDGRLIWQLLNARDPSTIRQLIDELPAKDQQIIRELSPSTDIGDLRAPVFVMHDHDDSTVPYVESRRLAASLPPGRVEYDEFTLFQHVDPTASVGVPTFVLETGRLFLHLFDIMRILLG